jgi:hypothetical protein
VESRFWMVIILPLWRFIFLHNVYSDVVQSITPDCW